MANRIRQAAGRYDKLLAGKSSREREDLYKLVELSGMEGPTYQTWQARAHAQGLITLEEATTIYAALGGEAAEWDPTSSLALRLAITQTMKELGAVLLNLPA